MNKVSLAVCSLRPDAEWVMSDDDVENITWHTEGVTPLTQSEVDAEMVRLESVEAERVAGVTAARTAAISHAKSLGFTDEMIAGMWPGLGGAL